MIDCSHLLTMMRKVISPEIIDWFERQKQVKPQDNRLYLPLPEPEPPQRRNNDIPEDEPIVISLI